MSSGAESIKGGALGTQLLEQVRSLQGLAAKALGGEPVHALRIALRRWRAFLELGASKRLTEEADTAVKLLQDALGAVRDMEIQAGWPGQGVLSALASERLPERRRSLARELERFAAVDLAGRWPAGKRDPKVCVKLVRKRTGSLLRRLSRCRPGFNARPAHRLRIAVKKLRYVLELCVGRSPLLPALEVLQGRLGRLHDLDSRMALARRNFSGHRRRKLLKELKTERKVRVRKAKTARRSMKKALSQTN